MFQENLVNCPFKAYHHLGDFFLLELIICKVKYPFQVMELHVKEQKDEKGQRKLTKKCWKTAGAKE